MTSREARVAALSEQVVRMHRSFNTMRQQMAANRTTSGDGVEWAAYGLLFRLVDRPMRSSALADEICVDPSTISRQVAQLVKAGLVERQSDPEDGRATLLVATRRGHSAFEARRAERLRVFAQVLAGWTTDDLSTLTELLAQFNDSIAEARDTLTHPETTRPMVKETV